MSVNTIEALTGLDFFPELEDDIIVGEITGPWGLRGHVKVKPLTSLPQRFSPEAVLYLHGRSVRVLQVRESGRGLLVKLDSVNDRSQAEALRGEFFTVPRTDLKPLPSGSFYHFQIIGIGTWTEGGDYLGEVTEILSTGANDVYVVQEEGKKEVLVPALHSVILEVSPDNNRMVVCLPVGLR